MNDKEQIDSVFGSATGASGNDAADGKDARIAELERELQREKVEAGRLKKTADELAALREENAQLKARNGVDAAIASVPEEIRNDIAPEVLEASGAMAASVTERMARDFERQNEEIRILREENARRDRNLLTQRIEMRYPGFLESVSAGGAKREAWGKYRRYNDDSILKAYSTGDFETIAYHIEMFCREIGVTVPTAQGAAAAPEPNTVGGNGSEGQQTNGKTYTPEEYSNLFDLKEAARDRGDFAEVRRLSDEINRVQAEGRVKE